MGMMGVWGSARTLPVLAAVSQGNGATAGPPPSHHLQESVPGHIRGGPAWLELSPPECAHVSISPFITLVHGKSRWRQRARAEEGSGDGSRWSSLSPCWRRQRQAPSPSIWSDPKRNFSGHQWTLRLGLGPEPGEQKRSPGGSKNFWGLGHTEIPPFK